MAKSKSTAHTRRGDPEFEREYLVRMGLVKPAPDAPGELEELQEIVHCCEFILPVAEAGAKPGNAPELVATWLKALAAGARLAIANPGGMGAVAPMVAQQLASQFNPSRT
jgi:hypothetical protein